MPRATRWCGARPPMSSPSSRTVPSRSLSRPMAARSRVLLPAPLWPSTAATPSVGTVTDTPCRIVLRPYPARMSVSSSIMTLLDAEVDLLDLRVGLHFGDRALRQDPAGVQHRDGAGVPAQEIHVVFDDHDGAVAGDLAEERARGVALVLA